MLVQGELQLQLGNAANHAPITVPSAANHDSAEDAHGKGIHVCSTTAMDTAAGVGDGVQQRLQLAEQELVLAEKAVSSGVAGADQRLVRRLCSPIRPRMRPIMNSITVL